MKVLVAMSGGLKSLVTAWLLKKQGMQVRGVYLDLIGLEKSQPLVEALERKLGISIQIIPAREEFEAFAEEASQQAMQTGQRLDENLFFHRSVLFPKLLELKSQHQFDKLATGHRVLVQEDQVSKVFRVYQNADGDLNDAFCILGRTQNDLASLLLPLGSIPASMFTKLSTEIGAETTWNNEWTRSEVLPEITFDVFKSTGGMVGTLKGPPYPEPGQKFHPPERPDPSFYITDISFLTHQVQAVETSELSVSEVHFQDASWFSRSDLGLTPLTCGFSSRTRPHATLARLLQYEGGRVKAHLNQTLQAQEANIFKGQTMLWVEGIEILGGGRVLGTR